MRTVTLSCRLVDENDMNGKYKTEKGIQYIDEWHKWMMNDYNGLIFRHTSNMDEVKMRQ